MKSLSQHNTQVKKIAKQIEKFSNSGMQKKLRFFHGDSNSTRSIEKEDYTWIDISHLGEVVEINKEKLYALVEPNVSMDRLVADTLKFGLIPEVVMEFPGITVGGGVNGAALESSSFKYGQFNDTCLEYEIILGNGKTIKASQKENKDIFYGVSGSYGSLGLLTLIKIKLIPSAEYVKTVFYPTSNWKETSELIEKQTKNETINFLEGIVFNKNSSVVLTGSLTDNPSKNIRTYTRASDLWFYEHARKIAKQNKAYEEYVPIKDYLFRYNRGAFWMGEYAFPLLHIPNNKISRFLLNPFMNTRKLHDGMTALNIGQKYFVQDFYVPYKKTVDLLEYSDKNIGIYPIWLCPLRSKGTPQKLSPHFINDEMLMDVGIWGKTEKYTKDPIGVNKEFEKYIKSIEAKKMLYAHAYYTEKEFWEIYDKKWYNSLRTKYYADKAFPNVWQKVRVSEKYKVNKLGGAIKIIGETLLGKHINT